MENLRLLYFLLERIVLQIQRLQFLFLIFRLSNVSALRSKLYEGVQTSSPEEVPSKDFDAETGQQDVEEPLTAEKQRQ